MSSGEQIIDGYEVPVEQLVKHGKQVKDVQIGGEVEGQPTRSGDRDSVAAGHSMGGKQGGGLAELHADLGREVDAMTNRVVKR